MTRQKLWADGFERCARKGIRMREARVWAAVATVVLMLADGGMAAFPLKDWRLRRAIHVQPSSAQYAEVLVDGPIYEHAQAFLQDVRIADDTGEEIAYVLRRWPSSETEIEVPARVVNRSALAGRFTRLELDVGERGRTHNHLRLEVDGTNFSRQATVEGSDDRRTWLVLATATIYRFTEGASVDQTAIPYPPSLYRYLRVTIHNEGKAALMVRGAALLFRQAVPAREDRWFAGSVQPTTDTQQKTTTILIDTQFLRVPISRVVLNVTDPRSFARDIEVAVSGDHKVWSAAGRATVRRGPGTKEKTPVVFTLGEVRGRYVRLTIMNGDNPPLAVARAQLYGIRRTILFPIAAGRSHVLYLGNDEVRTPEYDLPQVLNVEAGPPLAIPARLGPLEPNPAYVAPVVRRPWTEEHPLVLWSVLGLCILVLLALIVRTARSTGAAS